MAWLKRIIPPWLKRMNAKALFGHAFGVVAAAFIKSIIDRWMG